MPAGASGALLRLADSDLVLDEVDSYAPDALVAVLRLVQVAGMLGRSVICASATLPQPVAEAAPAAPQPRPQRQPRRQPAPAPDNGAREANSNTTEIPLPGSILPPI